MSTAMWIDFLLVIVFVACVWMAARRGIFNALSGLLGSVAGLLGALLLTPRLSGFTARLIRPFLGGMVRRAADSIGLTELLPSSVVEDTRAGFASLLQALSVPEDLWDGLAASAQAAGEQIADAAGQALAEQLAPVLTFVVLFLAIQLAVRIVCSLLSLDIPILRSVNRLGGALLGALTGLCMVAALCWGIMRFSPAERVGFLNQPALLESRVGGTVCGLLGLGGPASGA